MTNRPDIPSLIRDFGRMMKGQLVYTERRIIQNRYTGFVLRQIREVGKYYLSV